MDSPHGAGGLVTWVERPPLAETASQDIPQRQSTSSQVENNAPRPAYPQRTSSRLPPRKPASNEGVRLSHTPNSPVRINLSSPDLPTRPSTAQVFAPLPGPPRFAHSRSISQDSETLGTTRVAHLGKTPAQQPYTVHMADAARQTQAGTVSYADSQRSNSPRHMRHHDEGSTSRPSSTGSLENPMRMSKMSGTNGAESSQMARSDSPASSSRGEGASRRQLHPNQLSDGRPSRPSSSSLREMATGRTNSPNSHGSSGQGRPPSVHLGLSSDSRPNSYLDLLSIPYPQPPPAPSAFDNTHLRTAIGNNASLLSHKQTLEMYRANAKKTNDPNVLYEFAVFLVNTAQDVAAVGPEDGKASQANQQPAKDAEVSYVDSSSPIASREELLREARHILQRLSDKRFPFAQYYLGDGYASGLFNKGKEDYDKALPLFVAAGKAGHAESNFRAAICYEYGWGTRKDPAKAEQFYRQSASKNHPGAMTRLGKACFTGDLGLGRREKEGFKWLKRATEAADAQYNTAPYELGLLHETGYGDDIFHDEAYAAQLFTTAAEFGHAEASFRLGDAYEHGKLNCPQDPALSVHFYNGAAQQGHPLAMMALCAWYMVGAEPFLAKDENEAYEWARKAAELGLAKAEYAIGYFTEMGIGCRRDPLEANVWYVRAADQGDDRAKHRLAAIRAAATGEPLSPSTGRAKLTRGSGSKDDKDCTLM